MARPNHPEFRARLDELRALQPGWLDGQGVALDEQTLTYALEWVETICATGMPLPRTYPTPEGGLEVEWRFRRMDVLLLFEPLKVVTWHVMHHDDGEYDSRGESPADRDALAEIARQLQELWLASDQQSCPGWRSAMNNSTPLLRHYP